MVVQIDTTILRGRLAETHYTRLPDGRHIAYLDLGRPGGEPLFFFHGLPGSRLEALALHRTATQRGYRVIAPDRPGIGLSDYQPQRSISDWPADVAAIADNLGLDRFGVVGVSAGGPFALACASSIPERLDRVIDVAGSAPAFFDGSLDSELSPMDRVFARIGRRFPAWCLRPGFEYLCWRVRRIKNQRDFYRLFGALGSDDREFVERDEWLGALLRNIREAFVQGARGVAQEAYLHYRDWGFDLREISAPVTLLHGTDDRLVPIAFGRQKANQLAVAELIELSGQGHFRPLFDSEQLFDFVQNADPIRLRTRARSGAGAI